MRAAEVEVVDTPVVDDMAISMVVEQIMAKVGNKKPIIKMKLYITVSMDEEEVIKEHVPLKSSLVLI